MEGIELITQEEIMEGWKIHFQKLATPTDQNSNIDKSFEEQVFLNDLIIHQVCTEINKPEMPVTHDEVESAINHLKKNKAPDAYGITTEHIQLAQESLIPILTFLVNKTIELGSLP